jgi:POT family proton-dependent oligopeptide transporter
MNRHRLARVFVWFYFSINLGAGISQVLTPWLLEATYLSQFVADEYRSRLAFGVPGLLMLLATIVFWMGRHQFVHIPPAGWDSVRRAFTGESLKAIGRLSVLYLFVAVFWSIFDQGSSSMVAQAEVMDRTIDLSWISWIGAGMIPREVRPLASQIQSVNAVFILILIPVFSYVVYPAMGRLFVVSPLRKMGMGFFLTIVPISIVAWCQSRIEDGESPHVMWQILAFLILTMAEILISITGLEFSYTQAPKPIKSFIMSIWLLAVALGNYGTMMVNWLLGPQLDPPGGGPPVIARSEYFWGYAVVMVVAACLFVPVAMRYRGKSYGHDATPEG